MLDGRQRSIVLSFQKVVIHMLGNMMGERKGIKGVIIRIMIITTDSRCISIIVHIVASCSGMRMVIIKCVGICVGVGLIMMMVVIIISCASGYLRNRF